MLSAKLWLVPFWPLAGSKVSEHTALLCLVYGGQVSVPSRGVKHLNERKYLAIYDDGGFRPLAGSMVSEQCGWALITSGLKRFRPLAGIKVSEPGWWYLNEDGSWFPSPLGE